MYFDMMIGNTGYKLCNSHRTGGLIISHLKSNCACSNSPGSHVLCCVLLTELHAGICTPLNHSNSLLSYGEEMVVK